MPAFALMFRYCSPIVEVWLWTSGEGSQGKGSYWNSLLLRPSEKIQVSERAEKHPETTLDHNTQPHLVLLSEYNTCPKATDSTLHFTDEETEALWDPVGEDPSLGHGSHSSAATFFWGCLGSPVRGDSCLGQRGAWHMAGTYQVLSQYWFYWFTFSPFFKILWV